MTGRCLLLPASGTEFRGDRGTKSKPVPGPHLVYGFLTTAERGGQPSREGDAGDTGCDEEWDVWMRAPGMNEGVASATARRRAQDRHARHRQEDKAATGPMEHRGKRYSVIPDHRRQMEMVRRN